MVKITKLMLTLALLVMGTTGVKAAWEQVYKVDYSDYTSFPWYVMGFTPEFINGVMTDQGAEGWHQYFIADGIPTQVDGNYTVKAMIKGSEAVNVNVNMGWGWGSGESKGVEIILPTEWTEVEWSYEGVGGTSCNLIAQPWKGGVTIEWQWLEVGYEGTTVWKDIIVNGNMEGESSECFYITEQGVGGPFLAPLIAGVGKNGSKAVKVESYNNPSQDWDTQFFIRLPYQLPAGTSYKVSFDYKATQEGKFQTQAHAEPSDYIHWAGIGEATCTTEWKTFEGSGTISSDQSKTDKPMQTIAFNLGLNKKATKFYFDNVKFEVTEEAFATLTENAAVNPRPYPAEITSMAIVGFDGSWDASAGWAMTQDADDDAVWTLTKIFTADAGNYEYKAAANGNWDRYVLPSGDNASYTFPAAGDYQLTFTVNTKTHTLNLVAGRILNTAVIVGDFLGLATEADDFNPANGWAMTQDATNPVVWTLTKDFTAEAKTYRYKAVGNGSYDAYQLPGEGNNEFEFGTAEYPVGNYELTFTLNTEGKLELAAVKKADTYTVAGSPALFGSDWDVTDANNELTQNADGTYSITYTDVALTGNVEYKVVMDNDYAYGSWPAQNRVIGISMPGTYDITINFNPADGSVWETMAVAKEISAAGYATFCAPYALNFNGTGVQAYFAKNDQNDGKVHFYEIFNAPAQTGLLLKAATGTYKLKMEVVTGEAAADVTGNLLNGVLENTEVDAGSFVLLKGNEGVGFYKTNNKFTVGAHTAYIPAQAGGARSFIGFNFDDNTTTAIEGVATVEENNGEIYNLQGQRVVKAQKGLYIINGKKVMVK